MPIAWKADQHGELTALRIRQMDDVDLVDTMLIACQICIDDENWQVTQQQHNAWMKIGKKAKQEVLRRIKRKEQ